MTRFASAVAISALAASAAAASIRRETGPGMNAPKPKALFYMGNEDNNTVTGIKLGPEGGFQGQLNVSTGGKGGFFWNQTDNQKWVQQDVLYSSTPLVLVDDVLFAVNAGDDSVSMFMIDNPKGDTPHKLKQIGTKLPSGGSFPNVIAANKPKGLVCVGNTGSKCGVSCARFTNQGIAPLDPKGDPKNPFDALRPVNTSENPDKPTGPTNTFSALYFSPQGDQLLLLQKGDETGKNQASQGNLAVWAVESDLNGPTVGRGNPAWTNNNWAGSNVKPFAPSSMTLIPGTTTTVITDSAVAGQGFAVDFSASFALQANTPAIAFSAATSFDFSQVPSDETPVAIRRVAYSGYTGGVFITDEYLAIIRQLDWQTGKPTGKKYSVQPGPEAGGFIDLVCAGKYLYTLSPGRASSTDKKDAGAKPALLSIDLSKQNTDDAQSNLLYLNQAAYGRPAGLVVYSGGR